MGAQNTAASSSPRRGCFPRMHQIAVGHGKYIYKASDRKFGSIEDSYTPFRDELNSDDGYGTVVSNEDVIDGSDYNPYEDFDLAQVCIRAIQL